ncbi:MAG: hypothetical protein NVSMB9_33840 [Isosphaeraceae bacterium]
MSCSERHARSIRALALILTLLHILTWHAGAEAGEALRITSDGTRKLAPVFAPGGEEIVFAKHDAPALVALMRMKRKGTEWGEAKRIFPDEIKHQFDPALSRDGRFLAFGRSESNPQMVLVLYDLKEAKEVVFKPSDGRATARSPSFSADGARVAFSLNDTGGGHRVASVNPAGEDLKTLTQSSGANSWPAFSPDGRAIAFASSRDGDFELYAMDAQGGGVRRLTRSPGRDMRPAWSPDGRRIAFVSTRDGNEEIYVMNADGTNPRNLTHHPDRDTDPSWHPDGHRLLFVAERRGKIDLYLMDVPD